MISNGSEIGFLETRSPAATTVHAIPVAANLMLGIFPSPIKQTKLQQQLVSKHQKQLNHVKEKSQRIMDHFDTAERVVRLEAQVESIRHDVNELKTDVKELHSRITTGNREIMDKIDNKIDSLAHEDHQAHMQLDSKLNQLSKRIAVLEQWRWMLLGAACVIGFVLGQIEFKALLNLH